MAAPLPTKEQVVEEMRVLLARALTRIARDEAAGRLSPEHIEILAQLRVDMAREAAATEQQRPAA